MYQLKLTSHANREFQRLASNDFERIAVALKQLRENPRPPGVKKLRAAMYRIRTGYWRIIYAVSDRENLVVVLKIVRRSEDTYDRVKDLF